MPKLLPITESGFLEVVIQFAQLNGWRVIHVRPARTKDGWRTPIQGDGKGFPDVLMLRGGRLVVTELKISRLKKPTPEQQEWLDAFMLAGAEVYLWSPEDWTFIQRTLAR